MAIWTVSGGDKQGECEREETELQLKCRVGSSTQSRGKRTKDVRHGSLTRCLECCSGST